MSSSRIFLSGVLARASALIRIVATWSVVCVCLTTGCSNDERLQHGEGSEAGPSGGRVFRDGGVSLELSIFEEGMAPRYRAFVQPREVCGVPDQCRITATLTRIGRAPEAISFTRVDEFFQSDQEISEPHSFAVSLSLSEPSGAHHWSYDSVEARTVMSDEVAKASGVVVAPVERRTVRKMTTLRGKIAPSEHRIAHIIPRFAGVVREGRKHIGDRVERGEVLAVVESNQSLQPFEVRSQIAGTVINGHVTVGEFVPENQWIYVVADLSEVWADLYVPLREGVSIREGDTVSLRGVYGDAQSTGKVIYIAPFADERSQSRLVRVEVRNETGRFPPGAFVVAHVPSGEAEEGLVVALRAVQRFRGWDVVFRKVGEVYEAQPLELGESDGELIVARSGLRPGDLYVIDNPFLIKADILKSGASHDH